VSFEPVVGGLDSPLAVTHAGDGSGRLFVAQQGGAIRIVRDGALVETPFIDIGERIRPGGERGLLGLAFHPDYPEDPRFFVNYTDEEGDTQIAAYEVDPANGDLAVDEESRLLTIGQPYANHNGGALAFGPDGYLYIATGDGGSGGDPHGFGQALDAVLGKILRVDVDTPSGDRRYSVPDDNPFAATEGARPEIWHYGLRNPWRMSFDRATGDLWIGDVGQNAWEEIDVARAGTGGLNFGWNRMEASHCFRPDTGCEDPAFTLPITEYGRDEGGCTVIGGNVYRGAAQPALSGGYVFADYCAGLVWAIPADAVGPMPPVLVAETATRPSAFGEDEAGELFVTDISSGELLRVVGTAR
jgi:glucose/arabinose dehydrogenase